MSAGRLGLFEKQTTPKDRSARLLLRFVDGTELGLREFGTKQRAWAKLLPKDAVADNEMVATLGPEAWPAPPLEDFARLIDQPRHLHPLLRDQRSIAGIGRTWVDEILWEAASLRSRRAPSSKRMRSSACTAGSRSSAARSTTTRRSSATSRR